MERLSPIAAIDHMDERSEDRAPAQPASPKIFPCRVRNRQQRIGCTLMRDRRVMKFVPAKGGAGRPERHLHLGYCCATLLASGSSPAIRCLRPSASIKYSPSTM